MATNVHLYMILVCAYWNCNQLNKSIAQILTISCSNDIIVCTIILGLVQQQDILFCFVFFHSFGGKSKSILQLVTKLNNECSMLENFFYIFNMENRYLIIFGKSKNN
jgi:uncharacterized membrane protein YwaF